MKYILTPFLRWSFVLLCVLSFPLVACSSNEMPAFSLESATDGKLVNSSEFQNKALLLNFFATWCPPCRAEIPDLVKIAEEYNGKDFVVIGMSTDFGRPDAVSSFMEEFNISYPVLMATDDVMMQFGGVYGIPISFLVDRQGNVVKMYKGIIAHDTLVKDINSVLE